MNKTWGNQNVFSPIWMVTFRAARSTDSERPTLHSENIAHAKHLIEELLSEG